MSKKILLVDDEKNLTEILAFNLKKEGYEVLCAYDGEAGLQYALKESPDLVVLDVMMPKMDGFEVCKKIREKYTMPIIMLTARDGEVDIVLGLELGADDYVTKPFGTRELMARIKANLRKKESKQETGASANSYSYKELEIDFDRYQVKRRDEIIEITLREFELLKFLATQKSQIFSREVLLEKVWGYEYFGDVRTVDVTIRRLREKIEDDASNPQYILTKRGVGYYFGT